MITPISVSSLRLGSYGSGLSRIGSSPETATTQTSAVSTITATAVRTPETRIAVGSLLATRRPVG